MYTRVFCSLFNVIAFVINVELNIAVVFSIAHFKLCKLTVFC